MNAQRLTAAVLAAASLAAVSGCATTATGTGTTVRQVEGAYQAPSGSAIPGDIREILMAGGLDASDPAAPTDDTRTAEVVTSVPASSRKVRALVAALEDEGRKPQEAAPTVLAMAGPTPTAPSAAKPAAIVYPEVGAPAPSVAAVAAKPAPVRRKVAAAVPAPEPKPLSDVQFTKRF